MTSKAYYAKNRDALLKYSKTYHKENKGYFKEYNKNYYEMNKEKEKARQKAYYSVNKEKHNTKDAREKRAAYKLKVRYGLSKETRDVMLVAQTGRCAICNNPFKNANGEPAVDHNHSTGDVRGLLCFTCNTSLAVLESPLFPAFQDYLKRTKT